MPIGPTFPIEAPPPPPPRPARPAGTGPRVRQSEVLSALSRALDMTEGQPVGHTLRSCAIALRLGEAFGLDEAERSALYFAVLLRRYRGAEVVRRPGFPPGSTETVRCLHEHWWGLGCPSERDGEEIPMVARIANLARTVEIFLTARGVPHALRVAREGSGSWFDPRLVEELLSWRHDYDWWARLRSPDLEGWVIEPEPGAEPRLVDDDGLDDIARSFADIIDAKSPYTFRHSRNVAHYAIRIAERMGTDDESRRQLYRAGLLHDIGKLGVSNRILEKEGALSAEERAEVELHPLYSWRILSRVDAFRDFARTAVVHHEKLDGSGYPWKLVAADLNHADRVLCVADIYEALTADRPYRAGMPPAKALGILRGDAGTRLCAETVDALGALIDEPHP